MADWHLEELRRALERRPGDQRVLHIDFEGLDDLRTLPLPECYGCHARETGGDLYFERKGLLDRWRSELQAFVMTLES